jgi:modification methylase
METNRIYNEPCEVTMSRIPDNSIDLVVTSPPYNKAGHEGFIRKRHVNGTWQQGRNIEYGGEAENDFMDEAEYQAWQIRVLDELHRILKPNGSVFYNHKIRVAKHRATHPIEWIGKSKLTFRQQITWNRRNSPNVAPIRFLPNTELIFWLTKTACQPNFERIKEPLFGGEVWEIVAKPNPLHPAPMPIEIPMNIMSCLKDKSNIIVYDPFMGIGTTAKAAKKHGFAYIGSELNERYHKIACDELANDDC